MDEACALIKTELDSMPTELDEINRRKIMQLEIEEAASEERGRQVSARSVCRTLQHELAELREDLQGTEGSVG